MPFFLANAFLLFGLVAALPIMLHLLHHKKPEPILFGAMRFLGEAIAKSRRSRRITQCFTLLLRVLIILLLACAFARPVVKFSRFIPAKHRTLLVVLDASASMQAKEGSATLFELSKTWVTKLLAGLAEGDKIAILAPGRPHPRVIFPPVSDIPAVENALAELAPAFGAADIPATICDFIEKDASALQGMELHIFSDFQAESWPQDSRNRLAEKLAGMRPAIFFNRAATLTTGDRGFTKVDFNPAAIVPGSGYGIHAILHGNDQYAGNAVVTMENNLGEQNHSSVDIMPGEDATITLNAPPPPGNTSITGTLRCDADAYPLNDDFFYSLPYLEGVPVLVVYGNSERDSFFLKHALQPGQHGSSLLRVEEQDWNTFLATDYSTYELVIVCNPPHLSEAAVTRLLAVLKNGHSVMLFAGEENGIKTQDLQKFSSLKGLGITRKNLEEPQRCQAGLMEQDNPLAQRLARILPSPWAFTARSYLAMTPGNSSATPLLEINGSVIALNAKQGEGNLYLFGMSANRDWSDWPLMPSYLVCLQELTRLAINGDGQMTGTRVGIPLSLTWPGDKLSLEFDIGNPDGTSRKQAATRTSLALPFVLNDFYAPGHYAITAGGRTVQAAVNIPLEECTLNYCTREELLTSLPNLTGTYSANHSQLRKNLDEFRQGSPLWPLLIVLAFFLAILEVLYANVKSAAVEKPRLVGELLKKGGE